MKKEISIRNRNRSIFAVIYYPEKEGKGPAVIMSHGYNGSHVDWDRECTYFSENGFVALAFDFCGGSANSKSDGSGVDMTISSEVSDLLAVFNYAAGLDQVDDRNIFFQGGSQGGLVSALTADKLLDKVRGVMLYYPAFCIADDWTKKYETPDEAPEVIPFWNHTIGRAYVKDVYKRDFYSEIGKYKGNVLIIHGDKDPVVSMQYVEKVKESYEHAELIVLNGEGHGFSPDAIKSCTKKLLSFMEENLVK